MLDYDQINYILHIILHVNFKNKYSILILEIDITLILLYSATYSCVNIFAMLCYMGLKEK